MPVDLMHPTTLNTAATIDDAAEVYRRLLTTDDGDELADLLEHAVDTSDRAHALLFMFLAAARGWPTETGVEMVQIEPRHQLIVPR